MPLPVPLVVALVVPLVVLLTAALLELYALPSLGGNTGMNGMDRMKGSSSGEQGDGICVPARGRAPQQTVLLQGGCDC